MSEDYTSIIEKRKKIICQFCGHRKGLPTPKNEYGDPCGCSCHH